MNQLPIEHGGNLTVLGPEQEVAASKVAVSKRDAIDRRSIVAQPLRRQSHQRIRLDAILFPYAFPPIDLLDHALARVRGGWVESGHIAVPPVELGEFGEVANELGSQ